MSLPRTRTNRAHNHEIMRTVFRYSYPLAYVGRGPPQSDRPRALRKLRRRIHFALMSGFFPEFNLQ